MMRLRTVPCLISILSLAASSPAGAEEPAPAPAPVPASVSAAAMTTREEVISPLGAVWRSTLVPGWGQRYKGEHTKGWIFTATGAGLGLATVGTLASMDGARKSYYGADPASSDSVLDAKYNTYANATVAFTVVGALTAAFWTYNVAESAFTPLEHLRVKDARVRDVFPAMHKYYETNPIAVIGLENRSGEPVRKVRVRFEAKGVMDLPAEAPVVDLIPAGLGKSVELTAVFNKSIFAVGQSEPRQIPAKITIEYEVGRKKREITRTANFTVYNRNAIVWDDTRKMASFITPREDGLKAFASAAVRQASASRTEISSVRAIANAAAYFDALGAIGMVYVSDPSAPFTYFDGNAEAVDFLAYPRETLTRKTGDCDDLTALYASLLESSGIATAIVDVPGHVFVMFDSGMTPDEMRAYLGGDSGFHVRNGNAWVPVEVTAVGKSFSAAWSIGAVETKKWAGLNQLKLVDVVASQIEFPPSPPDFGAVPAGFATIDAARYLAFAKQDADRLAKSGRGARDKAITEVRGRKLPPSIEANEIGIILARDGQLDEAEAMFRQATQTDPRLARAWNNLANIAYLRNQRTAALAFYEAALKLGGDNATILVNKALLHYEEGQRMLAKDAFQRAVRLEPVYKREFPELTLLLDASDAVLASNVKPVSKAAEVGERDPRRARWLP